VAHFSSNLSDIFGDLCHLCFKQGGQKATSTAFPSFSQERSLKIFLTLILRGIIHPFGWPEWF
jgi:hypothetical protein